MLEDFYRQRIKALEQNNAELRSKEIELTEYIYTLLEKETPQDYKNVVRSEVFNN